MQAKKIRHMRHLGKGEKKDEKGKRREYIGVDQTAQDGYWIWAWSTTGKE